MNDMFRKTYQSRGGFQEELLYMPVGSSFIGTKCLTDVAE